MRSYQCFFISLCLCAAFAAHAALTWDGYIQMSGKKQGPTLPEVADWPLNQNTSKPALIQYANADGSLEVAWQDSDSNNIIVTHVTLDQAANRYSVYSLGCLAGYTRDEAQNDYLLTAIAKDDVEQKAGWAFRPRILQLVKIAPNGQEVYRQEIGQNPLNPVYCPMAFGTARLAYGQGKIAIACTQLAQYDAAIKRRNQTQSTFILDAATGKQLAYYGGPTHCLNTRLAYDQGTFVGLSEGDADPRGILVSKMNDHHDSAAAVVFASKGQYGSIQTFVQLGQLVAMHDAYGVLFTAENSPVTDKDVNAPQNLAFMRVGKDITQTLGSSIAEDTYNVQTTDQHIGKALDAPMWSGTRKWTGHNRGIVWLMQFTDPHAVQVRYPDMVRLKDNQLLVLWEAWKINSTNQPGQYDSTQALLMDDHGKIIRGPSVLKGLRLHPQDDVVVANNQATWVLAEQKRDTLTRVCVNAQLEATTTTLHLETPPRELAAPTGIKDVKTDTLAIKSLPFALVQVLGGDQHEVLATCTCDEQGNAAITKPNYHHGWCGTYYADDSPQKIVQFKRSDAVINYRLPRNNLQRLKNNIDATDCFHIKWSGFFDAKIAGDYMFTLGSDPNASLSIGDKQLTPKDFTAMPHEKGTSTTVHLTAGFHGIEVQYRGLKGTGSIWVTATPPGGTSSFQLPIYWENAVKYQKLFIRQVDALGHSSQEVAVL